MASDARVARELRVRIACLDLHHIQCSFYGFLVREAGPAEDASCRGDVEAGMKYDFGALHSDSEVNSTGGGTGDGVQVEGFLLSDLESTRR